MPKLTVEISEKAFRSLKLLEAQSGVQSDDLLDLVAASAETLGNLLAFIAEHQNRGKIELVVRDEGSRHYSRHTSLDQIIPFHLLKPKR